MRLPPSAACATVCSYFGAYCEFRECIQANMIDQELLAWAVQTFVSRNWAMVVIASTIITLIVLPIYILRKYVRIALNVMESTQPPLARDPLDFERVSGEVIRFPSYDGMPLTGMIVRAPADVPRRGMLVFAHEFCSDLHSCSRYCRPLIDAGYDVFAFDFRGHGQSPGEPNYQPKQWITDREMNDIRGAVAYITRWLEERKLDTWLALFGISRGACAAILTAAENEQIVAVVADGSFSTDSVIEHYMRRWAYIFATVRVVYENHHPAFWRLLRWLMMRCAARRFGCRFPSVRKAIVRMSPRPILFIHGERDSYLPVEQSRKLYALAPQPKTLWVVPGARHNQAVMVDPKKYARLTLEFLNTYFDPTKPALASPQPKDSPASVSAPVAAEAPAGS